MDHEAVSGSPITSEEGSAERFGAGRVCRDETCETRLSIYNDGAFCSVHAPMVTPRTRGKKLAS